MSAGDPPPKPPHAGGPHEGRINARRLRLEAYPGEGDPPLDSPCDVLCEDHVGTYTLPFACAWTRQGWTNVTTGEAVTVGVVAWRLRRTD